MDKDPFLFQTEKTITTSSIGSEVVSHIVYNPETVRRQAQIRELIAADFNGEEPNAIFPLSGGITQRENGRWTTLNGSDVSELGLVTVGRMRVIAGAEVARIFPGLPVITNSYNRFDSTEPTMASVVKNELVQRKIDPERIILEEESFSTITQFTEMIKMAVREGWDKISVITNKYNLTRATIQYERLGTIVDDPSFQEILRQFKEQNGKVSIIDADTILSIMSDHFTKYMDQVAQTTPYQETVRREAEGVKDLLNGEYQVALTPEKPRN